MTSELENQGRAGGDRPDPWLWTIGVSRLGLTVVVALGAYLVGEVEGEALGYLLAFYALGFASGVFYLVQLQRRLRVEWLFTWAQVLIDFGVVAATIGFTGGPSSFFTFLFVVVILEAGLLLGIAQGFVMATLATAAMAAQFIEEPVFHSLPEALTLGYSFVVQTLAFYLTASVSGYWNMRVNRIQQFQRELLDNLSSGFLITDVRGVVTALNTAGRKILDLDGNEAIGRPVSDILRVASGDACPVMTALRSGRDFTSYEFNAITEQGVSKILGLTTNRVYDHRRNLIAMIVSFTDLTEMAHLRAELQRQDRLAVVGEVAAGLAHEIRNPVAAISGAMDELRSVLETPQLARKLLAIGLRECDQLNHIVTGFLDYARNPAIEREQLDVRDLIEETRDWASREYEAGNGFAVALNMPDEACVVSAARSQLKQVFVNLVRNGIEAMDGQGVLALSVARTPHYVEVRFDDDGPGIEPDKVARIFEPFYTTKSKGVGMGLAVCLRIVTAHDGTIRAVSREPRGTSMTVRLPAAQAEE